VALELYKAFSRSKQLAFEQARTVGAGYFFFVEELSLYPTLSLLEVSDPPCAERSIF